MEDVKINILNAGTLEYIDITKYIANIDVYISIYNIDSTMKTKLFTL